MARYAVGVDIGGTTIKAGRVRDDGDLAETRQVPTPRDVGQLARTVRDLVTDCGSGGDPVGVVTAGLADEAAGRVLHSASLGWRDLPLRDLISDALGRPVTFGHDVRGAALAESRWGAGEADMVFVPVGTGLASALMLDGRVRGTGWAGEIGQLLVPDPDDATTRVPLERVSSASAVARRYARQVGGSADGGARHVVDRLRDGDPVARAVVETAMDTLADALAVAVGLLGPVTVVLGGGLAEAGDTVLGPLRSALGERLPVDVRPPVRAAALGRWAGCLGAAALALPDRHVTAREVP